MDQPSSTVTMAITFDSSLIQCLVTLTVIGLFLYCVLPTGWLHGKRFPPGPWALPVVGYFPFLGKYPHLTIDKLGEKYGPIFKLRIGNTNVIVLNSVQAIKEAFVKNGDIFTNRSEAFYNTRYLFEDAGVFAANGELWKKLRSQFLHALKLFGAGTVSCEQAITDESELAAERMLATDGVPFDPMPLVGCISNNVMWQFLFGTRFDYDDANFHRVIELTLILDAYTGNFEAIDFMSWLRFLPDKWNGLAVLRERRAELYQFIQQIIDDHERKANAKNVRDFIDCFLAERAARKEQGSANFIEDVFTNQHLINTLSATMFGGTITTTLTLTVLIKTLSERPDIQAKVVEEVDRVIGQHRVPTYQNRMNMPFTEATILEAQRVADITPLGTFKTNSQPVKILGYDLPSKSVILANYGQLHSGSWYWRNPDQFDPAHFLDANGKVVIPEHFMPFGQGKRMCPGQSQAKFELFLVTTSLMQRLTFHCPDGVTKTDVETLAGVTPYMMPFKIVAKKRMQN